MKVIVDENIPLLTVNNLKLCGYDVLDIRGTEKEGIPDNKLWNLAQKQERLLITTDKGFAKYRFENHHGILIILLKHPNRIRINDRVMSVIPKYTSDEWKSLLVIVKDTIKTEWRTPLMNE